MKGRFLSGFLLILFILQVSSGLSEAGGVGLPIASVKEKGLTSIRLDYERLEPDIDSDDPAFGGESREERILISAGYAPVQFVDLYLRIGTAAHETASRNFNGTLGPAYGVGAKWTFYKKKDFSVGMGAQILEFWTDASGGASSQFRWDEIEAYLGGALEGYERMIPYFGVKFSKGRGKFKGGPTVDLENFADVFFGAQIYIHKGLHFLSEARLLNENGLTFSLVYDLRKF